MIQGVSRLKRTSSREILSDDPGHSTTIVDPNISLTPPSSASMDGEPSAEKLSKNRSMAIEHMIDPTPQPSRPIVEAKRLNKDTKNVPFHPLPVSPQQSQAQARLSLEETSHSPSEGERTPKRARVVAPKPSESLIDEQLRATQKLKQQQQAIIESRQLALQQRGGSTGRHPSSQNSSIGEVLSRHSPSLPQPPIVGSNIPQTRRTKGRPGSRNMRNLTIYAPSYSDTHLALRSAPLNLGYHHQQQQQQQVISAAPHSCHQQMLSAQFATPTGGATGSNVDVKPNTESRACAYPNVVPANNHTIGALISPRATEFAPKAAVFNPALAHLHHHHHHPHHPHHHLQPHPPHTSSHLAYPPPPDTAPILLPRSARRSPPIPVVDGSTKELHRQSFLAPFEKLYENINAARALKSTLEDQMRKSTALLQTLQQSTGMIEGLVHGYFREAWQERLADQEEIREMLVKLAARVERLEGLNSSGEPNGRVPSNPPSTGDRVSGNADRNESTTVAGSSNVSPPATKEGESASQMSLKQPHPLNPVEYEAILGSLRERLEKLERQVDV
ncbi:uncharacterized protein VTP21DRAFT_600 [Calcarisporiella thermophila]|uniref:uncharacterized protein n=1 Tax=Calcarisporiella thermophila TaxID=911321 RepID=UPI0037430F00